MTDAEKELQFLIAFEDAMMGDSDEIADSDWREMMGYPPPLSLEIDKEFLPYWFWPAVTAGGLVILWKSRS